MNYSLLFYVFLNGLLVGSFLNVVIYRLPRELPIVQGRSQCPSCGHLLAWNDLVPVLSWFYLGRKCRYCRAGISARYPVVELSNALLWTAVVAFYGFTSAAAALAVIVSCLLAVALIDWDHQIIPDRLPVILAMAGAALGWASGALSLSDRLIGAGCVSLPLLAIALLSRGRAMGGGDVKLTAAMGLCLGWRLMLLALVLAAVGGTLTALVLRRTRWALGREVPFGTFLALAGMVCIFAGDLMLAWYLALVLV